MTTRAALRATVRAELNDAGGSPLWSDALLNQWLAEAIRDYGRSVPRESSTSIAAVANQADYSLPADCQRVVRVEHPTGFFRVPDPLSAGDFVDPFTLSQARPTHPIAEQLSYEVWGVFGAITLTLRPAPTDATYAIKVRYHAVFAEPAADGDTILTPAQDDDLLQWFVCNRALQWLGTDESKRQRWERDRGASAQGAAGQYERDYRAEIRRRARRAAPRRLVVRA
jgi:hypothetical protein